EDVGRPREAAGDGHGLFDLLVVFDDLGIEILQGGNERRRAGAAGRQEYEAAHRVIRGAIVAEDPQVMARSSAKERADDRFHRIRPGAGKLTARRQDDSGSHEALGGLQISRSAGAMAVTVSLGRRAPPPPISAERCDQAEGARRRSRPPSSDKPPLTGAASCGPAWGRASERSRRACSRSERGREGRGPTPRRRSPKAISKDI